MYTLTSEMLAAAHVQELLRRSVWRRCRAQVLATSRRRKDATAKATKATL